MKSLIISVVFFLLPLSVVGAAEPSQEFPVNLDFLRDYAQTRGFMLGRPVRPQPMPDGKSVLFLRSQARVPKLGLYEFDVASGKTRELLTPEQVLKGAEESLTPEEKARRERQRVSVGGFTTYQVDEDGKQVLLSLSGRLYLLQRETGALKELQTGKGTLLDPRFSPDGRKIAYVLDHDLYVLDLASHQEKRLTQGGSERLTHGVAEFVAQEEMNRFTGYWWSPDSSRIVYEEADATAVEVWQVADPAHPETPPHPSYYPRPGKENVKVRVGVLPAEGGETVWLKWDSDRYPYLTQVRWDRHGPLTLTVQTRLQNELVLLRADPTVGSTETLVKETDAAWVNLHQDVPRWLPDEKGFLWISEMNGGPRLELRGIDGKLTKVLVPTEQGFDGVVSVDQKGENVVYQANDGDPTQLHLYRLNLTEGARTAVSRERGLHTASFSRDHQVWVKTSTTLDALPTSTVHRADGTEIGTLPPVAEKPSLEPRVDLLTVGKAPSFHAAILRPRDFDPRKKYPVLLDVYGGPKHLTVQAAMRSWLLAQWLAEQGFIVVAVDNRGTPGRGRDWERAVYEKFGSVPLDDQVAGLKALCDRFPEMDRERVGIYGWSFGGYMSALAVLRRPDVFRTGVAGAPVTDWLDYDTHYTERYLGLPAKEGGAYAEGSLLTYAPELRRPLLLIHGTSDDNVYFRHTLRLADALFRAGKEFDLLPLSGLTHMVPDALVTQRLWSRIAGHFRKHLGTPTSAGTP